MYTRKQYLQGECTHEDYYNQFVTDSTKKAVLLGIGMDELKASTDEHMNDIPLYKWDSLAMSIDKNLFKEMGDSFSMAGAVCVLKATARELLKNK